MKSFRVFVLFGALLLLVLSFAACGGGGGGSNNNPTQPLMITSSVLPQGIINNAYTTTLQASGGTGTYTWGMTGGTLPPGLTLNSMTAMISGTPTAFGSFTFTAQVTDGAGHMATAMLTLDVEGALLINCNSCATGTLNLPVGMPGVPYSATLSATGGTTPYSWCVVEASGSCDNGSNGALPAGLTISTQNNNGVISGTPTGQPAAPLSVTVQVNDSETIPAHGTLAVILTIFSIVTKTLPNAIINQPYQAPNGQPVEVISAGGVGPYTWCVLNSAGACDPNQTELPPGLTLGPCVRKTTSACPITGTATQLGLTTFNLQVTDSQTPPAVTTGTLSIDVTDPVLSITTKTFPNGFVNLAYNVVLQYTGGNNNNTWSLVSGSGSLPAGMSLNSSTGAITGTPTTAGTSTFVVQVQDTENPPQIATSPALSITVNAAIGNSTLNGIYVFSFNGYSGHNSSPVIMAGAFQAAGNGNITAGELDYNAGAGEPNTNCSGSGPAPQTVTASQSSYSIQPNGLGTMTLVTNTATYNFTIAIRPDGSGTLIQDNTDPATRGSGVIVPQTAGVGINDIDGKFVVGLIGADPSDGRYAAAGLMNVENNDGDIGSSPLDVDDAGTASQQSFKGTLSTTVDPLGRGCFGNLNFTTMIIPSCGSGQPNEAFCYAYYLVSGNQFVLISTDPVPGTNNANLALWSVLRQNSSANGLNNGTLAVPAVVELNARDASGSSDVTAGLFVGQGTVTHTCPTMDAGTLTFDENQNGSGPGQQVQTATGSYCVDSGTGRVTLTGFNGWSTSPPVMYLGGADPGFVVGTDNAVTAGLVEIQSGGPFSDANILGGSWGGTFMPAASIVTDSVTQLFADGGGDIIGTQYTSGPDGSGGPTQLTLSYSVDATGSAVVTQNGNEFGVLYVVSASKVVLVPSGSNPALNVFLTGQ